MTPVAEFFTYAAVGAAAQLIDGSLGMAYGVTSAGMLLSLGMPPAMASAGNVRWRLFFTLVIPGVIGAVIGAHLLTHLPSHWVRVLLTPYLLLIGLFLLLRARRSDVFRTDVPRDTVPLGLLAGFLDAVGGGGWSALTVTTLVARKLEPRRVIGSVHLAKCVVSAAAAATFLLSIGAGKYVVMLGLIVGGVVAAPFGALLARRMPPRLATLLAGLTVFGLGINNAISLLR